jgi:hypothetical protein
MLDFVTGPGWHVDTNFKALMGIFAAAWPRRRRCVCVAAFQKASLLPSVRAFVYLSALMNRRRKLDGPCY